ncbi:hypothetical protein [Secundilactobacillus yichangensis]|uniref:hypothetical protein n=1 Tax=Secundilactobacillus yichangensis TaxID=2799580 RepID=UPI001944E2B3|nr:hypothetical protein [Secundilactobacillus yichangensis]
MMITTSRDYITNAQTTLKTLTKQVRALDVELTKTRLNADARQRLTAMQRGLQASVVEVERQLRASKRAPQQAVMPVLDLVCK